MTSFLPKINPSPTIDYLNSNQNGISSLIKPPPFPYPPKIPTSQSYLENFPKDFYPTALAKIYKQFYPEKYYIPTKRKKEKKESWLDFLNPFECESDYDEEEDDYADYMIPASNEFSTKRKFLKFYKHKLKKKKKKKKIVLFKILIGILVFIAVKVLLEKLSYYFPTFVSTGRDISNHHLKNKLHSDVDFNGKI